MICPVCGGGDFTSMSVLWPQLIDDWQLADAEVAYINRQQGEFCKICRCNLRSLALCEAIRAYYYTDILFKDLVLSEAARRTSLLEINEAGNLTPFLKYFGGYVFGAYPEVDIHQLPYADDSFDLVVHSDTLEHVPNPIHALSECRRVLRPGGALCFTVPIVVGRLSRSREGLRKSYHGNQSTLQDDWAVQTEFGSDAWTYILAAGFSNFSVYTVQYPSAIAFLARK
jgi:SAM-dependent methyltransferase